MIKIAIMTLLVFCMGFTNSKNVIPKPLKTGYYYVVDKPNQFKRQLDKGKQIYFLNPTPIVTVQQFAKLAVEKDEIVIKFNDAATATFSLATKKYINKKIALIIDDQLIVAPIVQVQIPSGIAGFNVANYSKKELDRLVKILNAEMR